MSKTPDMVTDTEYETIQVRRDTGANWATINPVLAQGEPGFETDTGKLKIGDGSTAWNSLSYLVGSAGGGSGNVTGPASAIAGDLAALDATGKLLSDSGVAASGFQKNSWASGTFAFGSSSCTVTNIAILATSIIEIAPQADRTGTWQVYAYAGGFIIISTATETVSVPFLWIVRN